MEITDKQYKELEKKANKWDELNDKIANFYPDEDNRFIHGDLGDIGEVAAAAFRYL